MLIRSERPSDAEIIGDITTAAFATMPMASGDEAQLIERLRSSGGLALSLVAEIDGQVVGHIGFSPVTVNRQDGPWYQLSPVSVRPDLHKQGIGSALIIEGIERLKQMGAETCLVLGHAEYYPRFGFESVPELSDRYPEQNPFFMRLVLKGEAPVGKVSYHPAFGET